MANGQTGLAAGTAMCQQIGADHVCDYLEMVLGADVGELANVPAGTTAWVNRTTTEVVNGVPSPAGPGGNCNNWTFNGNHLADGEYATFVTAGVITFHLDNDTLYDPANAGVHTIPGDLECGGIMRSIFCCYPACP